MSHSNAASYDKIVNEFVNARGQVTVPEMVIKFAEHLNPGNKVLDLGCGNGVPIDKYLASKKLVLQVLISPKN